MLCQFSVKNYKCFKEEITLDMQATNISEHEQSLLIDIDGEKILPIAVIYGPNGSGKSTVLSALLSLASKVMQPICATKCGNKECVQCKTDSFTVPYKFSKDTIDRPTEYQIFFRTPTTEYEYFLTTTKDRVFNESLYKKRINGSRYSTVFIRQNKNISLFGSFKKYETSDISENLTLLSYFGITHGRNAIIKDVIEWFENSIMFINYGNPTEDARISVTEEEKTKDLVLKMLLEMDINISDYRVEKDGDAIKGVFTSHVINGKKYELEISEESNGTIKAFGILPHIVNSILNGTTLVIDELDAKLHPLLLNYIIKLYSNPETNTKNSQLIFTSHDLSTMNKETFRRDEIWFTAKSNQSSSKLYSLVEFKKESGIYVRNDEMYSKQYLEGRYGADPYFQKLINWGEL